MSRTRRRPTKHNPGVKGWRRDGEWYHPSRGCENGGDCPYCQGNRKHKHRRGESDEVQSQQICSSPEEELVV